MTGRIRNVFLSKRGEGYVGSGVKILIAVVIGALLLTGVYFITKDVVIENASNKVRTLFDYGGEVSSPSSGSSNTGTISFTVPGVGTYTTGRGSTWGEWYRTRIDSRYDIDLFFLNRESKLICYDTDNGFCRIQDAFGNDQYAEDLIKDGGVYVVSNKPM